MYISIICNKRAKLMDVVGALAPTVFLTRPKIIHISVPLFLPHPEDVCTYTYLHPRYLVQFAASEYASL